jgi:hypothetical protein
MAKFFDHVTTHQLDGCFALTLLELCREEVAACAGRKHRRAAHPSGPRRRERPRHHRAHQHRAQCPWSPVPLRELAIIKATHTAHLRERPVVSRTLTDTDLLLSRIDGTWLPVGEYSREFAALRTAAGLEGHSERMTQAVYGRGTDDR